MPIELKGPRESQCSEPSPSLVTNPKLFAFLINYKNSLLLFSVLRDCAIFSQLEPQAAGTFTFAYEVTHVLGPLGGTLPLPVSPSMFTGKISKFNH